MSARGWNAPGLKFSSFQAVMLARTSKGNGNWFETTRLLTGATVLR